MHWSLSAPAWGFFSVLTASVLAILQQVVKGRKAASRAEGRADVAATKAEQVRKNTQAVSNGFAAEVRGYLRDIVTEQRDQGHALREHLQWHLDNPKGDK